MAEDDKEDKEDWDKRNKEEWADGTLITPEELESLDDFDALLKEISDQAEKDGCFIEGCKEKVTGMGDGNPYCSQHFWQELNKKHPCD